MRLLPASAPDAQFEQPVVAFRTTDAFDAILSANMRVAWKMLGGDRGQAGHAGDPHVFVRMGERTSMIPRDALANLDPVEAAAIRRRAMAVKPRASAPPKPW